jgi:hypothetical protein
MTPNARGRARVLWLGLALLWAPDGLANAGGYQCGVKLTGSLAPFQASGTEHVRILEEHLDIALRRTDAAVVVRYTMQNTSAKPVKVRLGFPVETTRSDSPEAVNFEEALQADQAEPAAVATVRAWLRKDLGESIQQLHGYALSLDEVKVPAAFQIEPFATGKVKPFPGSKALRGIGGWMVSDVTFPPGAPCHLEVRYTADHLGGEDSLSDNEWIWRRTFVYRLSTGAVWKGPIEQGTVTIHADGIAADEVVIQAPRDRFSRDGDTWTWRFEHLEPTRGDDLQIVAAPGYFIPGAVGDYVAYEVQPPFPRYLRRGNEEGPLGEASQAFSVKASSTLAPAKDHDFSPAHLAEERPVYPWAEGRPGPGLGEWVELTPADPRPLLALGITPGFAMGSADWDFFHRNARPSRVEILLNGEHRFIATLGDAPEQQLVPIVGYLKPVAKVRITILDVFPGTRREDTCLSRVVLYGLLATSPPVHGAP